MRQQRTTPFDRINTLKKVKKRIKNALVERFEYPHLAIAKSNHFLRKHASQILITAVMYADLVGSTKMRRSCHLSSFKDNHCVFPGGIIYHRTIWRVLAEICTGRVYWLLSLYPEP